MLPLLRASTSTNGEKRIADIADLVADEVGLTSEERMALLPSGRQRLLNNRLHWSKFYMSKAGLIASPSRGGFMATGETEEGREIPR
jgi:restriction system protein